MKYEYETIEGEVHAKLSKSYEEDLLKHKLEIKYKKAGIPRDYFDLGFRHVESGQNLKVVQVCKGYYDYIYGEKDNHKYSLYLEGQNSTGKTTAACAIGKQFIKNGKKVRFLLAEYLIDLLMKTSGYNYIEELEREKKDIKNCDLIIVDDAFDKNKTLMWETTNKSQIVSRWDSLLRDLISNNVKMIFTSNILLPSISNYYSASIYVLLRRNFKVLKFSENIEHKRISKLKI